MYTTTHRFYQTVRPAQRKIPYLAGEKFENWSTDQVKKAILELSNSLRKFNLHSMGISREPIPDQILTTLIGRPTSRKFLYFIACHYFGSWNEALKRCGIDPINPSYNRFWNRALIIHSIQALKESNHPLMVKSIHRDRTRKTTKVLLNVTNKATTGSGLHDAARRFFGSWDNALKASGLDPQMIKEKPFWTEEKVKKAIWALHKKGISLNSSHMGINVNRRTSSAIKAELGKGRVGRSLWGGAYRIFGSWDRALTEAGVNPKKYRKQDFTWSKRTVGKVLRILNELEVPVNASSLSADISSETSSIIYRFTGQSANGSAVFRQGCKKFGSWDGTLKYSGFWLAEIRRNGSPYKRNRDEMIELIRMCHKNDIALNCSAMIHRSNVVKFFTEEKFGSVFSGPSVMSAAKHLFGSWDHALWEAGLDPNEIRLRSRSNTSNLLLGSYQTEDVIVDGERRLSNFLGAPPKTPDELIEQRLQSDMLQNAVESCEEDEQQTLEKVFDSILRIHHYRNQEELISYIVEDLEGNVSASQVQTLLEKLRMQMQQDKNV